MNQCQAQKALQSLSIKDFKVSKQLLRVKPYCQIWQNFAKIVKIESPNNPDRWQRNFA